MLVLVFGHLSFFLSFAKKDKVHTRSDAVLKIFCFDEIHEMILIGLEMTLKIDKRPKITKLCISNSCFAVKRFVFDILNRFAAWNSRELTCLNHESWINFLFCLLFTSIVYYMPAVENAHFFCLLTTKNNDWNQLVNYISILLVSDKHKGWIRLKTLNSFYKIQYFFDCSLKCQEHWYNTDSIIVCDFQFGFRNKPTNTAIMIQCIRMV